MKQLLALFILALGLTCRAQEQTFTLRGTLRNAQPGHALILFDMTGGDFRIDTLRLTDGRFAYTGTCRGREQRTLMLADPVRLQQIFVNVIDNAFKYSDKQDALVTVNASVSRGYFKVVVSDNGCGISKEDLPHVKEKFYKANISVKGSGIGLAVCDELVRLHNGSLNLYSEPEIGTTVEILLPLAARKQEGK